MFTLRSEPSRNRSRALAIGRCDRATQCERSPEGSMELFPYVQFTASRQCEAWKIGERDRRAVYPVCCGFKHLANSHREFLCTVALVNFEGAGMILQRKSKRFVFLR